MTYRTICGLILSYPVSKCDLLKNCFEKLKMLINHCYLFPRWTKLNHIVNIVTDIGFYLYATHLRSLNTKFCAVKNNNVNKLKNQLEYMP